MTKTFQIESVGRIDPGIKREKNEDVCLTDDSRKIYLVADGIGGRAAGEVASRTFLETVESSYDADDTDCLEVRVEKCFQAAHYGLKTLAADTPEYHGMGCTAEVIAFDGDHGVIGHVGDSRTYLFREGRLQLLTSDHSFVHEQVKAGILTTEQARTHNMRNVILRAVGVEDDLDVDIVQCTIANGDILLLCTDGLTDMIEDGVIHLLLSAPADLATKAEQLIEAANQAGGKDNISLVLLEVKG